MDSWPTYDNPGTVYGYPYSDNAYDDEALAPQDNGGDYSQPYSDSQSYGATPAPQYYTPDYNANGEAAAPVMIYMRNGKVYTVSDYWVTQDYHMHLIFADGSEKVVPLDDVDLQRTNDENAKSGVPFILKTEPTVSPDNPDNNEDNYSNPAPAQPDAQPQQQYSPNSAPAPSQPDLHLTPDPYVGT